MSALALKRDKRKKTKPKLSFGSSSAACINLPSKIQANFADLFALLKRQKDGLLMYSESGPGSYSGWSSPDSAKLLDGGQLTESLLSEMSDKNWKVRQEALQKLAAIVDQAKFMCPELGDLPGALRARLLDSNKNLCAELQLLVKKQNNENSELRERLASLQEDHTCEMQQLRLKNEKLRNMLLLGTSPSLPLPNEVTFVRMVQLD